jgi:hypothetical protein
MNEQNDKQQPGALRRLFNFIIPDFIKDFLGFKAPPKRPLSEELASQQKEIDDFYKVHKEAEKQQRLDMEAARKPQSESSPEEQTNQKEIKDVQGKAQDLPSRDGATPSGNVPPPPSNSLPPPLPLQIKPIIVGKATPADKSTAAELGKLDDAQGIAKEAMEKRNAMMKRAEMKVAQPGNAGQEKPENKTNPAVNLKANLKPTAPAPTTQSDKGTTPKGTAAIGEKANIFGVKLKPLNPPKAEAPAPSAKPEKPVVGKHTAGVQEKSNEPNIPGKGK